MGANFSSCVCDGDGASSLRPRLGDIPESCVALVLMYLDPPDICKLARLNRAFRGASLADFIWESKLPLTYRFIMEKALEDASSIAEMGKRDVYARLCRPSLFDNGTKEIWLDKRTGGVCLAISSKALRITGIDDRRYWNHISTEESRFHTVAYLQQIWWLEVEGDLEFQFPPGTYNVFLRLQLGRSSKRLGRRVCNADHIHGWDIKPVKFQLTTSDGQHAVSERHLDNPGHWILYHAGDFVSKDPNDLTKIKFSLTQIDCTHTKGGLRRGMLPEVQVVGELRRDNASNYASKVEFPFRCFVSLTGECCTYFCCLFVFPLFCPFFPFPFWPESMCDYCIFLPLLMLRIDCCDRFNGSCVLISGMVYLLL